MNAIWQTEEYRDLIERRTASVSNYEPVTNAIQLDGSSDTTDLVFQDGNQSPVLSFGGLPFNHVFDTNYNTKTHVKYVTTIGSTTYTIDDSSIKQFDYEEKSITGDRFTFGDFISRVSTFTTIDTEGLYSSVSFGGTSGHLYLGVEKTDGSVFWIDYGTFYVIDCKKTYSTLWLSISDSRLLFNKTIIKVHTTKTIFEMCQEVCMQAGVTLGTTTDEMPNYPATIMNASSITNKSLAQVVSYLAQSIGAFAIIGKDDKLYFKWYEEVTPICSLPASNINANMTVADYEVSVTGLTWIDIDGVSHTIGTTGYVAKVEGNPFELDPFNIGTFHFPNYDVILSEMSFRILGTTYTPITLKYIGNPAIEVGDIVIASDGRGNAYSLPVTSIYISNLMSQEIRSVGESHVTTTNTNVSTSVSIEMAKQEAIAYAKYAEVEADRIKVGGSGVPGVLSVKNASDVEVIRLDTTGITMADGTSIIGGNGVRSTLVFNSEDFADIGFWNAFYAESVFDLRTPSLEYFIPSNFVVENAILYLCLYPQYSYGAMFDGVAITEYGYPRQVKVYKQTDPRNKCHIHYYAIDEDVELGIGSDITSACFGVTSITPSVPSSPPETAITIGTNYASADIKTQLTSGAGKLIFVPLEPTWPEGDWNATGFRNSGQLTAHLVVVGYKK